jgi:hypothetical protein
MFVDFLAIESNRTPDGLALNFADGFTPIVARFAEFEGVLVTLTTETPFERPDGRDRACGGPTSDFR